MSSRNPRKFGELGFSGFPRFLQYFKRMATATSSADHKGPKNRLQHEKSPYLLQHQSNPVDWYPWSPEAFALAKSLNKPIFLSVGYSTCHWCHVMERESFESPTIAKVMNDNFVNIKMDREERPDIDKIYMTFIQAISGSGGWPMSVWMTPDLKPFYGGTYYPPDDRYFGRPGFKALLESIAEQWDENPEKVHQSAEKILEVLNQAAKSAKGEGVALGEEVGSKCLQQLTRSYEPAKGGFSNQPKFPQPVNLHFLTDWALKNPEDSKRHSVLKMVETTLEEMAKGGIHDHIGQGFARYSTDKNWHVPHFEKMLYDQAQLAVAYANCSLLTKNPFYSEVTRDILSYVGRDLSHPEGGFYSAEDADSYATPEAKEKKEGAFYVWTEKEIQDLLGDKKLSNGKSVAELFSRRFGVEEKGNVNPYSDPHDELKGQNVIFEKTTISALASGGLKGEEVKAALEEARTLLFNYRNEKRPRPHLDSKFVTSWNALMITGYAKAGMALSAPEFVERAVKAMTFLEKYVFREVEGKFDLLRSCYRDEGGSESVVNLTTPIYGCVDDFANLVAASIDLYHATCDLKFLQQAIKIQQRQDELFWDEKHGGYFTSRDGDSSVIVRMKDDDDGAEPSSNSTSLVNLLRLSALFPPSGNYKEKVERLLSQFSDRLSKVPITLPVMAAALSSYKKGPLVLLYTFEDDVSLSIPVRSLLLPLASSWIGVDVKREENVKAVTELFPFTKEVLSSAKSGGKVVLFLGQNPPKEVPTNKLDDVCKMWETTA